MVKKRKKIDSKLRGFCIINFFSKFFLIQLLKFLKGFSGAAVDTLEGGRSQMEAYAIFYIGAGALGIPALILCLALNQAQKHPAPAASQAN